MADDTPAEAPLGETKALDSSTSLPPTTIPENEEEEEDDAPDPDELAALWEAVREGDQASMDEMLVGDEEHPPLVGVTVNTADEDGLTSLHLLTIEGHASVAQWLIDEVLADIDSRDTYQQTSLHHAAVKGHGTVAHLLLNRGADAMARDRAGWTPLHAAARSGFTDAAAELIAHANETSAEEAKAMVNCAGPRGETPLHRAAYWGHAPMVEMLLEHGAVFDQPDDAGRRPFDVVCGGGSGQTAIPKLSKLLRAPAAAA